MSLHLYFPQPLSYYLISDALNGLIYLPCTLLSPLPTSLYWPRPPEPYDFGSRLVPRSWARDNQQQLTRHIFASLPCYTYSLIFLIYTSISRRLFAFTKFLFQFFDIFSNI